MSAPNITVMLPTRGRYEALDRALATLHDTARHPEQIEYLLRTDDDMPQATGIIKFKHPKLVEYRGVRLGYGRMHDYYNGLASRAKGRLLLLWNDDTEMLTPNWDESALVLVDEKLPQVQFIRRDINEHVDTTLPFIDRRIFECLGHLSLHCAVDEWLAQVGKQVVGMIRRRHDIIFIHHRFTDQLMFENQRVAVPECERFFRDEGLIAARKADAEKIKKLYETLAG